MIGLIVLALVALIAIGPLALVLALTTRGELKRAQVRLAELERRLGTPVPRAPASEASAADPPAPGIAPPPVSRTRPVSTLPEETASTAGRPGRGGLPGDLEAVVGGQWLTWIGVLAIFFGTAFFLAYDLGESPFSGMGQIATGLLVGALFITAGTLFTRRTQRFLGQGLVGGGVALLFLAAYAAYGFHHLVPAAVVYPFLLGAAFVGAWVALSQDSRMVATLTLAGALLTPPLLHQGGDTTRILLPYLVAVNAGAVAVAVRRRWPVLPLTGWFGTAILVGSWWASPAGPAHRGAALAGVGALWLLYAGAPLLAAPRRGFWSVARGAVTVVNGLAFAVFLYWLMRPGYEAFRGVTLAALALLYAAGARAAAARRGDLPGVRLTHYTGIALAAVAVPVQFDLAWITLAWALLGAVLVWSGFRIRSASHRALGLAVYALAAGRVVTLDTVHAVDHAAGFRPLTGGGFWAGAAVAVVVAATSLVYARRRDTLVPAERPLATPLLLGAAVLLLWRISVEAVAAFRARELATGMPRDLAALLTLSLIWAVYAGALILAGFLARYRAVRLLGLAVLGVLVLKVFLFDLQELERGYRIASFVGVGLLLLAISVLFQRERRA